MLTPMETLTDPYFLFEENQIVLMEVLVCYQNKEIKFSLLKYFIILRLKNVVGVYKNVFAISNRVHLNTCTSEFKLLGYKHLRLS